jgi:hypothetical protein
MFSISSLLIRVKLKNLIPKYYDKMHGVNFDLALAIRRIALVDVHKGPKGKKDKIEVMFKDFFHSYG